MNHPQAVAPKWSNLRPRLARYLPAGQFNQLRALPDDLEQLKDNAPDHAAGLLLKANRALEPLHRVLVQYMPRYLIELDPRPGQPHGELIEGSFIFADVTGFTALTELLSRQGRARGPELMNQIMNRLFTEILDPLIASGGDLLIFAGDAALVYFPKQDNNQDVLQAVRAALRMERAILPFASFETEYGQCSLSMSAGVECGTAYAAVVGAENRMELLISGPGIDGAMQAEPQAEPGRVAVGEQARDIAAPHFHFEGAQVVDDFGKALGDYEISLPARKRGSSVMFSAELTEILSTLQVELERVEKLAPFLPEDMLAHLVNTDRHRQLVSEFRPVAVQFIHLVGLEKLATSHSPQLATQIFQRYFVRAQEIVTQHEGVVSQIDAYDRGFFLLNTYGTPKAHEGTTRYAVSAALQLARLLEQVNREFALDVPLQQRGGITYGLVFNGEIGARYRRESVVAGPAVNRAARLMSKAEFGQVILDAEIWADVQTAFVGERLPAVSLKGIEGDVVIINVHEIRRGTRLQPLERPLVGRDSEQAALASVVNNLRQTHEGSAWTIMGETGIGKTALILDLAEKARRQNLTVLAGRCQPHGKHIPLFVWIDLLTGWLDIDGSAGLDQQRTQLAAELKKLDLSDAEDALVKLLALSELETNTRQNVLPGLTPPARPAPTSANKPTQGGLSALLSSRLSQQAPARSGKTMWKRLEERISGPRVILQVLQQLAGQQPLLVILEDIHWLDRESAALLDKMLEEMAHLPILFALTGRHTLASAETHLLRLGGLADAAIKEVAQRAFGGRALEDSLAAWISGKSSGNPLYAQELCRALQHANAILLDRESGEVRWTQEAPALPLSLHELLLARLDELPLTQQDVLKRAAVMGVAFETAGLLNLCQDRMSAQEAEIALERITQAGFVAEGQNNHYHFNHPLMQEAIYTTLSFSQRRQWHTKLGDWLESRQPEQFLELIAYHYMRGNNPQKAAHFARRAGDKARERGAYEGATDYYEQVLALDNAPEAEKMAAAESKGDMLVLQKFYASAGEFYTQAETMGSLSAPGKRAIISGNLEQLAGTEFTPPLQAWAEGSKAWLLAQSDQLELALHTAQEALRMAEDSAKEAIESLLQKLYADEKPGPYEVWLQQFTRMLQVASSG